MTTEPWSWTRARNPRSTGLANRVRRSNCTASPSGRRAAPGMTTRFLTPGSAESLSTRWSVEPGGLTSRICSMCCLAEPREEVVADPDGVLHQGQADRDRDEQEMVDRRERELPPLEIERHPAPFGRREGPGAYSAVIVRRAASRLHRPYGVSGTLTQ